METISDTHFALIGDDQKSLIQEVRIMRNLQNERILQFLGLGVQNDDSGNSYEVLVLLPIMAHVQLNKYLKMNKEDDESQVCIKVIGS